MWWMVFEQNGERYVWIQEASTIMAARLKASLAGHSAGFIEAHELTEKIIKKLPKVMAHKRIRIAEAAKLLERLS
jgi:hypothetical protein